MIKTNLPLTSDDNADTNETNGRVRKFGIHGARGTGKSCFLAGLYGQRATKARAVNFPDDSTILVLSRLWKFLQAGEQPEATPLGMPDHLRLQLFADREAWEIQTQDYAGALVQRTETGMPELREDVKQWLRSCQVIFFFLGADVTGIDVRERINELGLLLAELKALSTDGNTIARPLALILTKWDTVVNDVSEDIEQEQKRAQDYLSKSPGLRETAELLQQCGDRVKVFPVSAFGGNREYVKPPSGGASPRLLHEPLVWAAKQSDEMLLDQATRKAKLLVEDRTWPRYSKALAVYDAFYREAGISRGPVFEEARQSSALLKQKRWLRRSKLASLSLLVFAATLFYGWRYQHNASSSEYELVKAFRDNHDSDEFAEDRIARADAYLNRWRNKRFGSEKHQGELESLKQDDEVKAKTYQEQLAFAILDKRHESLGGPDNAEERLALIKNHPLKDSRYGPQISEWLVADQTKADAYREEKNYQKVRGEAETHVREGRFGDAENVWQRYLTEYPKTTRKAEVQELIADAKQGRFDKSWNDLKAYAQANPDKFEEIIKKHIAFADQGGVAPKRKDQAKADVEAYREAWDRKEYDKVRDAARGAKDPESILVVQQLAKAYLALSNTRKARKKEVEAWLSWFDGLQTEHDYIIKVRSISIPADSKLAESLSTEEPRVIVHLNDTSHKTEWNKGREPLFNQDLGSFRYKWGSAATLKIEVEEYDWPLPNDWARGEAKDETFVLFKANGTFIVKCAKGKEIPVYLECPEVVPPSLPFYK